MKRYEQWSDAELAEKAQGGSVEHMEALIARYNDVCRFEARDSNLTIFNQDDRESECRTALLRAVLTYKTGCGTTFKSYAKTLMRRSLMDLARKENRRVEEVSLVTEGDDESTDLLSTAIEDTRESHGEVDEQMMVDRILGELQNSASSICAIRICSAIAPGEESVLLGQVDIFSKVSADEKMSVLAGQVQTFAMQVLEMRKQGWTYEEIGETLGVGPEICSLAIGWIATLLKPKEKPTEDEPVEQLPINIGLFEEAA